MQLNSIRSIVRPALTGAFIGIGLAVIFFAGFVAREFVNLPYILAPNDSNSGKYLLLNEVQSILDQRYLREQPDQATREYGAIRGLLSTIDDRYTFFIDPPVAASESDVLAGTYGGIGVQLLRTEQGAITLYPYNDSPANRMGIVNGDVLLRINGQPLDNALSQDAVDQLLRGEVIAGSGVQIVVQRADGSELDVFILFEVINVPSVVWRILEQDTRIGYLQIFRFTSRTPEELIEGIDTLVAGGASEFILDLRDNSGGLLQESIDVADQFLDEGLIVSQVSRSETLEYRSTQGGTLIQPLMVLVNERTASGAELVAGAIRDNQRGILVGMKTFGKGTVQQIFALSDQSSLHVTAAEWFVPSQRPLDKLGIEPDIVVETSADGQDMILLRAIETLVEQRVEITTQASPRLKAGAFSPNAYPTQPRI